MQDGSGSRIAALQQKIGGRAKAAGRPFLVVIDGPSGAGKSTLARALAGCLPATVVEGDDFFIGGVGIRDEDPASLAATCIDWRAQRVVLAQLLSLRDAEFHPFDWDRFDGSRTVTAKRLSANPVIILEGVYSNRPELRDLVDYAVLVMASKLCRRQRLIARGETIGPWETQWHRAEDWYFRHLAPPDAFDFIIDDADCPDP
ncbi:MAG: (d)CMP kinase [Paracoccus sp.]|jgi:uridine kinase|nr:(d)CMP kinase [Paracoccus sp. (in: a-proteobacteria)]